MATALKKVKSIGIAGQTKKGNDYWKVIWDDDKADTVFDLAHYELICEALNNNANVEIEKEKKGQYWNIKSVKMVGNKKEEAPVIVKELEKEDGKIVNVEEKMTKGDWDNKDKITRKSIERQKSLEIAERWSESFISTGTPIETKDLLKVAKLFEKYLETGE